MIMQYLIFSRSSNLFKFVSKSILEYVIFPQNKLISCLETADFIMKNKIDKSKIYSYAL